MNTENPFKQPIRSPHETNREADIKLVEKLLSKEEAEVYAKIRSGERKETKTDDSSDMKLTEEEIGIVEEAEAKAEAWNRDAYIEWAKTADKDEAWVDETFTFNDDGTVLCEGYLDLRNTNIQTFPDNLSVGGYLYLQNTNIQTFPDNLSVGGHLDLENTNIKTPPDNLSVGGHLYLLDTNIKTLPDNLSVGGDVWINSNLKEEAERVKALGCIEGDIKIR